MQPFESHLGTREVGIFSSAKKTPKSGPFGVLSFKKEVPPKQSFLQVDLGSIKETLDSSLDAFMKGKSRSTRRKFDGEDVHQVQKRIKITEGRKITLEDSSDLMHDIKKQTPTNTAFRPPVQQPLYKTALNGSAMPQQQGVSRYNSPENQQDRLFNIFPNQPDINNTTGKSRSVSFIPKSPTKSPLKSTPGHLISLNTSLALSGTQQDLNEISRLTAENLAQKQEIQNLKSTLRSREQELNKTIEHVNSTEKNFENYKEICQKKMSEFLLELTFAKRREMKSAIEIDKKRLGEFVYKRTGNKIKEVYVEGGEILQLKERLNAIQAQKEDLEKKKRQIASRKFFSVSKDSLRKMDGDTESENENESRDGPDQQIQEQKERINFHLMVLSRDETSLEEKLRKLEQEKQYYLARSRLFGDEETCLYAAPSPDNNRPAWPIIHNRYQILSLRGKGGFSEVYKAFDYQELRDVAFKVHYLNPNMSEREKGDYVVHAIREKDIHKKMDHPNIVKMYDHIDIDRDTFATIVEYCDGPELSSYLKQNGPLPEKEAKMFIKQLLAGLKYLHEQTPRVIHYDLKPMNILISKGVLKIVDFGLSKLMENDKTRMELTSQGVGTYWYLPPETFVVRNDRDEPMINTKVDIWSVGVIFFELLFARRPFGQGMSQDKILQEEVITKATRVDFPAKPNVSEATKAFIRKCLEYHVDDRYDVVGAYYSPYIQNK